MRALNVVARESLVASACAVAGAAEPGFSDTICPEATQYVLAVGKLRKDDPPQRIYDAAQAATDAYQRCSRGQAVVRISRGAALRRHARLGLRRRRRPRARRAEPSRRCPARTGAVAPARAAGRRLAERDADDRPRPCTRAATSRATSPRSTRGDHRKSMYHDSAKEIVRRDRRGDRKDRHGVARPAATAGPRRRNAGPDPETVADQPKKPRASASACDGLGGMSVNAIGRSHQSWRRQRSCSSVGGGRRAQAQRFRVRVDVAVHHALDRERRLDVRAARARATSARAAARARRRRRRRRRESRSRRRRRSPGSSPCARRARACRTPSLRSA